jgi:hypothetical protein
MTGEYTFVTAERQNELTRRIQQKLFDAAKNTDERTAGTQPAPDAPPSLATRTPATTFLQ